MPQNTVLPQYKADYPILAPAQKPAGVTISTALIATAVPNKPQWTGTQRMAEESEVDSEKTVDEDVVEEQPEEQPEEEPEEPEEEPTRPRRGRRR